MGTQNCTSKFHNFGNWIAIIKWDTSMNLSLNLESRNYPFLLLCDILFGLWQTVNNFLRAFYAHLRSRLATSRVGVSLPSSAIPRPEGASTRDDVIGMEVHFSLTKENRTHTVAAQGCICMGESCLIWMCLCWLALTSTLDICFLSRKMLLKTFQSRFEILDKIPSNFEMNRNWENIFPVRSLNLSSIYLVTASQIIYGTNVQLTSISQI